MTSIMQKSNFSQIKNVQVGILRLVPQYDKIIWRSCVVAASYLKALIENNNLFISIPFDREILLWNVKHRNSEAVRRFLRKLNASKDIITEAVKSAIIDGDMKSIKTLLGTVELSDAVKLAIQNRNPTVIKQFSGIVDLFDEINLSIQNGDMKTLIRLLELIYNPNNALMFYIKSLDIIAAKEWLSQCLIRYNDDWFRKATIIAIKNEDLATTSILLKDPRYQRSAWNNYAVLNAKGQILTLLLSDPKVDPFFKNYNMARGHILSASLPQLCIISKNYRHLQIDPYDLLLTWILKLAPLIILSLLFITFLQILRND